jgi:hypothetical protein
VADEDLLLVFTNAVDGRDAEFDRWYDDIHVPQVLAVPGVTAAQRYRVGELETPDVEGVDTPPPPIHRYLAVYRLDRDGSEVMAEFGNRLATGQLDLSPDMDLATIALAVWRPHGPERTA